MLRLTPHGVIAEIPLSRTIGAAAGRVKVLDRGNRAADRPRLQIELALPWVVDLPAAP